MRSYISGTTVYILYRIDAQGKRLAARDKVFDLSRITDSVSFAAFGQDRTGAISRGRFLLRSAVVLRIR